MFCKPTPQASRAFSLSLHFFPLIPPLRTPFALIYSKERGLISHAAAAYTRDSICPSYNIFLAFDVSALVSAPRAVAYFSRAWFTPCYFCDKKYEQRPERWDVFWEKVPLPRTVLVRLNVSEVWFKTDVWRGRILHLSICFVMKSFCATIYDISLLILPCFISILKIRECIFCAKHAHFRYWIESYVNESVCDKFG